MNMAKLLSDRKSKIGLGSRASSRASSRLTLHSAIKRQSGAVGRLKNAKHFGNRGKENIWPGLQGGAEERVSKLFNSTTMSDVIFFAEGQEIHAHTIVLCSASPVFYHRLFEAPIEESGAPKWARLWECPITQDRPDGTRHRHTTGVPPRGTPESPLRLEVDFKFKPFLEFIRYLYCNKAELTLDNVVQVLIIADDFKVVDLFDKCVQFMRAEIKPTTALRLTLTFRQLLCKACIMLWRAPIDEAKAMKHFSELDYLERKGRAHAAKSRSRAGSVADPSSSVTSLHSDAVSVASGRTSLASGWTGKPVGSVASKPSNMNKRGSALISVAFDVSQAKTAPRIDDSAQMAAFGVKDVYRLTDAGRTLRFIDGSKFLSFQLAHEAQEYAESCWRCVKSETEGVVSSPFFKHLTLPMVKEVLSLGTCNAAEILLFRALNEWAEHWCRLRGLPYLPEHKRQAVGTEALFMIRFPIMDLDEILWEVVPSGFLLQEEFHLLQHIKTGKAEAQGTIFNGEVRKGFSDLVAMLRRAKDDARKFVMETRSENTAVEEAPPGFKENRVLYTPAADDHIDAILGAKLLRDHVNDRISGQNDARLAQEVGVPPDPERRPIFCGDTTQLQGSMPESLRNVELAIVGSKRDPMLFLKQQLRTKALPVTPTPKELGIREAATPTDFQRLSPGLYTFRGERTLEMRLEDGDCYVYDAPERPASAALAGVSVRPEGVGQRPHSVSCCGEGGAALRARLGMVKRRVPLDGFLANSAQ